MNDHLLLMERIVEGNSYYTLVGGSLNDGETPEQALSREVFEETGLKVTNARLVFTETNPAPTNNQYIYLCEIETEGPMGIQLGSEEDVRNKLGLDEHKLTWVHIDSFAKSPFRTPQLQTAIVTALKKGFPASPAAI